MFKSIWARRKGASALALLMLGACGGGTGGLPAASTVTSTTASTALSAPAAQAAGPLLAPPDVTVTMAQGPTPGKIDPALLRARSHARAVALSVPASTALAADAYAGAQPIVHNGKVLVELTAEQPAVLLALRQQLQARGFEEKATDGRSVGGWLPVEQIDTLSSLQGLLQAHATGPLETLRGSTGPGYNDVALLGDVARNRFKVTGKGVKIGIISSSFNMLGTMQASVLTGDLPGPGNPNGHLTPVRILVEGRPGVFPVRNTDEGRAMAELIHDIAPDAELLFSASEGGGPLFIAAAMERLAQAGADIIVDDVVAARFAGSWFQDDPAARKVNELVARGVHYFSAAGNYGVHTFFQSSFKTYVYANPGRALTFNWNQQAGGAPNPFYVVTAKDKTKPWAFAMTVQWDAPWPSETSPGAPQRLEWFLLDQNNNIVLAGTTEVGGRASLGFETSTMQPSSPIKAFKLMILKPLDGKPMPRVLAASLQFSDNAAPDPRHTLDRPTIFGHRNAKSAIAVGTSSWYTTPLGAPLWNRDFAGRPATIGGLTDSTIVPKTAIVSHLGSPRVLIRNVETLTTLTTYSSVGGGQMLFDDNGNRLATPEIRQQPKLVAADASLTSFFGRGVTDFPGTYWFFGTSASAPNAAAVAALALQASKKSLSPAALESLLMATAQDMDDPFDNGLQIDPADPLFRRGIDFATGAGLVQADPAVVAVRQQLGTQNLSIAPVCVRGNEQVWFASNPNGFGVEAMVTVQGAAFRFEGESVAVPGARTRLLAPQGEYIYTASPTTTLPLTVELRWTATPLATTPSVRNTKRGGWVPCA